MLTFFFNFTGPLLLAFPKDGTTKKLNKETLQKLRHAITSERLGMLLNGVIRLNGNARPHTAIVVRNTIQGFGWEMLKHPPYSPDLYP